jgi:hypothetical protein
VPPPTIAVSTKVLKAIQGIRDKNGSETSLNDVIESLLRERNALPEDTPTMVKDHTARPRYRTQRDAIRALYARYGNDREKIAKEYAALEEQGEVKRRSDTWGIDAQAYALALLSDGLRKKKPGEHSGWLETDKGRLSNMDQNEIDRPRLIIKKNWVGHGISIRIRDKTDGTKHLYPHDDLIQELKEHAPSIFQTDSWVHAGYYHWPSIPSEKGKYSCIRPFLSKFKED